MTMDYEADFIIGVEPNKKKPWYKSIISSVKDNFGRQDAVSEPMNIGVTDSDTGSALRNLGEGVDEAFGISDTINIAKWLGSQYVDRSADVAAQQIRTAQLIDDQQKDIADGSKWKEAGFVIGSNIAPIVPLTPKFNPNASLGALKPIVTKVDDIVKYGKGGKPAYTTSKASPEFDGALVDDIVDYVNTTGKKVDDTRPGSVMREADRISAADDALKANRAAELEDAQSAFQLFKKTATKAEVKEAVKKPWLVPALIAGTAAGATGALIYKSGDLVSALADIRNADDQLQQQVVDAQQAKAAATTPEEVAAATQAAEQAAAEQEAIASMIEKLRAEGLYEVTPAEVVKPQGIHNQASMLPGTFSSPITINPSTPQVSGGNVSSMTSPVISPHFTPSISPSSHFSPKSEFSPNANQSINQGDVNISQDGLQSQELAAILGAVGGFGGGAIGSQILSGLSGARDDIGQNSQVLKTLQEEVANVPGGSGSITLVNNETESGDCQKVVEDHIQQYGFDPEFEHLVPANCLPLYMKYKEEFMAAQ